MENSCVNHEFRWLAFCAAFALGEALGLAGGCFAPAWPAAAISAALAALYGFGLALRGWRYAAAGLVGLALALQAAERKSAALEAATAGPGPHAISVVVDGEPGARPAKGGGVSVSFPASLGPAKLRVAYSAPAGVELPRPGETWECAGWLARGPCGRSPRRMFWARGAGSYARLVSRPHGSLRPALARARADLSRRVGIGLEHDPASAAVIRAILLGERSGIDKATRGDFVAAGTIHVFAVSGLHVMVVAKVLEVALALLFVPCRLRPLALLPTLWLYAAMIGAPPSAVRAASMASLYFAAPLFWRRPDGVVSWALTFLGVHALDPFRLADVGCGLSFAVMLALVLWGRLARHFRRGLADLAGVTFVAWAAGAPIAAHVFGRVTPGGLVSNLALAAVAGIDVAASALGVLASFASETLAAHVNNFAALATRVMVGVSKAVAHLPGANFEVEPWPLWLCLGWYVALGLAAWLWKRRRSGFWCR